ncbi:IclR family transcriptional regulator [Streptomyces fractus]|uniref:IclR family transcriptional regulator n=1 Tax=Streptomyces fractus TaxID=641806 RepID=UPI003CEAC525
MTSGPDVQETGRRSAARRLLAVLGAFDHSRPALSLTGISRRAALPLATTHRLVGELAAWGALERDAAGRYHVGPKVCELAALAPRGLALREAALPHLDDLYDVTHDTVHLAVRDGLDAVTIERVSGRRPVDVRGRAGARGPLYATGAGLVLLAHSAPALQEQLCARPLPALTAHTLTDPALLRRTLAQVRRNGCALADRQLADDLVSVAAPVRGARGEVVAAVSLVRSAQGEPPVGLGPLVRVTARGISRALGWTP